MVMNADGDVLTNNHVIVGATEIRVTVPTTGITYAATLVGVDSVHDIAVLRLARASGLTPVAFGNSDLVRSGDPIAAIGNAGGKGGKPIVALGQVIGLKCRISAAEIDGSNAETLWDLIQVQASVLPGASGGALADANGRVIGLITAGSTITDGSTTVAHRGYAIPINAALSYASNAVAVGVDPG
jgi:S1-C subfamily serine protease